MNELRLHLAEDYVITDIPDRDWLMPDVYEGELMWGEVLVGVDGPPNAPGAVGPSEAAVFAEEDQ